ncbi:MAG: carbon-nitrogen hydrolase family protein [bacterium]
MSHKWAVAQTASGNNLEENLATAEKFIHEAAREGCELIAFPEHFLYRDTSANIFEDPWTLTSPPVKKLTSVARSASIGVLAGSVPLVDPDDENRAYNTCLYIDSSGTIAGQYRKIHLFSLQMGQELSVNEAEHMERGDQVVDLPVCGVHCGLAICYDLRFPEIFRILAEKRVQAIFIPSCFTFQTGQAHWEPLLRARAIENQCYVIAPNQRGVNPGNNVRAYGRSMVVDPWGEVVARASDREEWFDFHLKPEYIRRVRKNLPALNHIELRGE